MLTTPIARTGHAFASLPLDIQHTVLVKVAMQDKASLAAFCSTSKQFYKLLKDLSFWRLMLDMQSRAEANILMQDYKTVDSLRNVCYNRIYRNPLNSVSIWLHMLFHDMCLLSLESFAQCTQCFWKPILQQDSLSQVMVVQLCLEIQMCGNWQVLKMVPHTEACVQEVSCMLIILQWEKNLDLNASVSLTGLASCSDKVLWSACLYTLMSVRCT